MRKTIPLEPRLNYFHGQLLLEKDFSGEQLFHVEAQRRHNRNFHRWGVVEGLEVTAERRILTVHKGFALDREGNDLELLKPETLEISGFGPHQVVKIGLSYWEEEKVQEPEKNRRARSAVLSLSGADDEEPAVLLAEVKLDEKGEALPGAVDYTNTQYARVVLGRHAITAEALAPELRTGWLRLPFRADKLVNLVDDTEEVPAFRVGPTETRSPGSDDQGAGGTMAIPIPLGVRRVLQFRVAGSLNLGEIDVQLNRGGWDAENKRHHFLPLVEVKIPGGKNKWFDKPHLVPEEHRELDPEFHTLAVRLVSTKKASISLIAVQFEY